MESQTQAQIQMNFTQHTPSSSELFEDLNWLAPLATTFTSLQVLDQILTLNMRKTAVSKSSSEGLGESNLDLIAQTETEDLIKHSSPENPTVDSAKLLREHWNLTAAI